MRRSVLERAAGWIRRALPQSAESDPGDVAPSEPMFAEADLRLIEFLGNDLSERARALRGAIQELDPNHAGSSRSAFQRSLEEVERLEELAHGLTALVQESRTEEPLVAVDLVDPMRRALTRLAERRGGGLPIRVSAPAELPRVLAKPPALVRTLSLCLEASALTASDRGPLVVHFSEQEGRVCALFRAENPLSIVAPRIRERLHASLALASRLASTFGAEVQMDSSGACLAPRLSLAAEI